MAPGCDHQGMMSIVNLFNILKYKLTYVSYGAIHGIMVERTANLSCPACQTPLHPKVLGCDTCGIRVEGAFELNEFATLSGDDLHLLRIFVLSEGRIRDMEAPLGLSYPTIRTRLKALRARVADRAPAGAPTRGTAAATGARPRSEKVDDVLERLQAGELSFEQAMTLIKRSR